MQQLHGPFRFSLRLALTISFGIPTPQKKQYSLLQEKALPAANQKNTSTKGFPTNHLHKSCWRWKMSLSKMVISTGEGLRYPMPRTLEEYYSLWQACICNIQLSLWQEHICHRNHMGVSWTLTDPMTSFSKVHCFHEWCKTFLTGPFIHVLPWTKSHESLELGYVFMKSSLLL